MRLRIDIEVDVVDRPKDQREQGDPILEDYEVDEIISLVEIGIQGMLDDPDMQTEMWAGSDFYGQLANCVIIRTDRVA